MAERERLHTRMDLAFEEIHSFKGNIDSSYLSRSVLCTQGSSVSLIQGSGNDSTKVEVNTNSTVDVTCSSPDGCLVLLGLRNGLLLMYHKQLKAFFSKEIVSVEDSTVNESTFAELVYSPELAASSSAGSCSVLILLKSGNLYIMNGIPYNCSAEALGDPKAIIDQLQVVQMPMESVVCAAFQDASAILCSTTTPSISAWKKPDGGEVPVTATVSVSLALQNATVQKILVPQATAFMITLFDDGSLAVWNKLLFVITTLWCDRGRAVDAVLWSPSAEAVDQKGCKSTLFLCCLVEDHEVTEIQILDVPQLSVFSRINVTSRKVHLVRTGVLQDFFCFVERAQGDGSCYIKKVSEAKTTNRLSDLLNAHKFNEAELYAEANNLDKQDVYKKKSLHLLHSDGALSDVIHTLDSIEDVEYIADFCSSGETKELNSVLKLLLYAEKKVSLMPESHASLRRRLLTSVRDSLYRLASFNLIMGPESFSFRMWQRFRCASVADILRLLLAEGKMAEATLVWQKHQKELLLEVDKATFCELLQLVPTDATLESVSSFAGVVLEYLVQHFPKLLTHYILWLTDWIACPLHREDSEWIVNSLEVLRHLLCQFHLVLEQQNRRPFLLSASVEPRDFIESSYSGGQDLLKRSIRNLEELDYVQHQLHVTDVHLEHVAENTSEELVCLMLDRTIAPEQVTQVVKSQVVSYCSKHKLTVDRVLVQYVKTFLHRIPLYQPALHSAFCEELEAPPWETKALAIVHCIESSESILEATCEITRFAPIPWREAVEALVHKALQVKLPLVVELKKLCKLAQWKKVGRTYRLTPLELENVPKTNPKWIAKKIIFSSAPTAVEDLVKVADMCNLTEVDIHQTYIQFLVGTNKLDDVEEYLNGLSASQGIEVAEWLVVQAMETCSTEVTRLAATGVKYLTSKDLKTLSASEWSHLPLSTVASALDGLLALQTEFSEDIPLRNVLDEEHCEQQVRKFITSSSISCEGVHLNKLIRYANCYGIGELWALCELMLHLLKSSEIERASKICQRLSSCDIKPSDVDHIYRVVDTVWSGLSSQDKDLSSCSSLSSLLSELSSLVDRALACSKDDDLLNALEVSTAVRFMTAVDSQCSTSDDPSLDSEKLLSSLHKEILEPVYQEEALMLEQKQVLPLVAKFQLAKGCFCPSDRVWGGFQKEEFLKKGQKAVSLLRDNGLYQHALGAAQEILFSLDLHFPKSEDLGVLKEKGKEFINSTLMSLIEPVLRSPKLDHLYGLTLLLCTDAKTAINLLLSSRRTCKGYTKIMALSDLSVHFGEVVGRGDLVTAAVGYYHIAKWGKTLRNYKIDYSGALKGHRQEVELSTLHDLMSRRDVPMNVVMEYSKDMSQPVVDFPAVYLQTVLTKWGEGYEQRLCALLKQLPYSVARTCLEDSCAKVSPYDYERLEFILQQLVALEEKMTEGNLEEISKNLTVLQWMKLYERQAPPSKYDLDYSEGCESVTRDCTSISTTAMASLRLPYHALIMGNPQNIINPELNLCSMESLLKVAPLLKISSNDIFVVTIKNVASKLQQLGSAAASPQMVQSLEEIFERITDPHLAMVCGQWLKHLLKGEHRTQMLKKTAHFAKYWLYAASTKEEKLRASEKFEDLVHEVKQSTLLHLLEKNNLDSPEAVELVSLPEDLVVHLYTERGSREGSNPSEAPNVHEIAMETASIFHINIKMVKKQLLNSWLHLATTGRKENLLEATLDATQLSLDETLQIANGIQDTESDPQKEDIYFRRLVYLTSEQEKIEENVATLLSYAKHSSSAFPYKCRVLALRLVLHIASCDMVERISQRTIADIMYLKQVFHFLSELELVNINTNLQAYESCDKTAFVKMILKTHGHQPKALQTAVDIMAFHGIFDESLWNQTLHGLMNLKQVKALRRAVVWLSRSSPPDCQVSSAVDAWDCVLRQPLQDAELPLTSGIRDSLLDTFYLLLVCPCIFSLDMKYFIKSYHRLQMPECALVCTYLVPSIVDRKTLLKNIVKSLNSVEEVKRNLQKLSVSREILTAVTQILNESDSHDESAELFYYV